MVMGIPLTLKWSSGGRRMGGNVPPPPPAGHVGVYNGSQSMKRARLTEMRQQTRHLFLFI